MKKIILLCILLCIVLSIMTLPSWAFNVYFSWGESSGQVDGYRIYWGGDGSGGPYSNELCEVNGTTFDYDASLNAFQKYWLVCRAFNQYGESGDSNEVSWPDSFKSISAGGIHSTITCGGLIQ